MMWFRLIEAIFFASFKALLAGSASPETCVDGVLDFSNRGLPAMPEYDSATCGIDGPQAVYASGNDLGVLQCDSFAEYSHLQLLNLSRSNLTLIEDGAFEGAVALTDMDISGNPLSNALVGEPFRGTSLEILSMRNCSLLVIDEEVFAVYFSRLRQLDMSDNRLIYISKRLLVNLPSLEKLNLSFNNIENIDSEAFAMNRKLMFIHLGNNRLREFPKGLFDGLDLLRRLVLVGNPELKGPIYAPIGTAVDPSYLLGMGTTTAAPPPELVEGDRPITIGPLTASHNDAKKQDERMVTGSYGNAATVFAVIGAIASIILLVALVMVLRRRDV